MCVQTAEFRYFKFTLLAASVAWQWYRTSGCYRDSWNTVQTEGKLNICCMNGSARPSDRSVSGTTMPTVRSSRVLYDDYCLWYFVLWFSSCWSGMELRLCVRFAVCYNTLELLTMRIVVPETYWASNKICNRNLCRRRYMGARPLRSWFRIPPEAWMSVLSVVCCQVEVSATSWSLIKRSPTDCGVLLCVI